VAFFHRAVHAAPWGSPLGKVPFALMDAIGEVLEAYAAQKVAALEREIERLNGLYEQAVKGRADFRDALRTECEQRKELVEAATTLLNDCDERLVPWDAKRFFERLRTALAAIKAHPEQ
jgi:hypothetical protein